jgi:hypothetical protein
MTKGAYGLKTSKSILSCRRVFALGYWPEIWQILDRDPSRDDPVVKIGRGVIYRNPT